MAVRKGVIFTFISIALLFVTVMFLYNTSRYRLREEPFLAETKIISMDRFISDTESDLERALYIASFRALIGMNDYIDDNHVFIDNIDRAFAELAVSGTYNGTSLGVVNDSNLLLWAGKMNLEAANINLHFNVSPEEVHVRMVSPWNVRADLNSTLTIRDLGGTAAWKRAVQTTTVVTIIGFLDPAYTKGSNSLYYNDIEATPYVVFSNTDVTNLRDHWHNQYYTQNEAAPDYLQRLAGDLDGASPYGIESLVDSGLLDPLGLYLNKSVVDFIYWDNMTDPIDCPVDGMGQSFRLDNGNATRQGAEIGRFALYNVTGLTPPSGCT
ncbi:MAG: hypothetical protein V1735_07820 [Nanoarchaeota archaeon]